MSEYWKKLKDPRWQKKRLEVMEAAQFTCKTCGSKTETLTVHHINYRKGAEPWEYDDGELACLCEDCHKRIEEEAIPGLRRIACMMHPAAACALIEMLSRGIDWFDVEEMEICAAQLLQVSFRESAVSTALYRMRGEIANGKSASKAALHAELSRAMASFYG